MRYEHRKALKAIVGLMIAAFLLLVLSAAIGTKMIPPMDVLKVLFGGGNKADSLIILKFRLPRIATAALVGAALALSGAILQGIVRNPLASPDIIGVTGGASVAAVIFINLFQQASIVWLPPAAFAGAILVTGLIYFLAYKKGISSMRLVLVGVGINAVTTAFTTLFIVSSPTQLTAKAFIWLTGSVYGSSWTTVLTILPWTLLLFLLALLYGARMNLLQLGDDVATGAGTPVSNSRTALLAISAGLAGSAVAVAGAVGFVALLAPHIARKLVGPSFGVLLPASALAGACIVMLGDFIARSAFSPLDLPVGIFTAAVGAPFFIYLLRRQ
ncbi:FecCD family ABC transporter permease [Paenibacillus turpanensis]|uniref:FecCD family ABC transporter permease n=1 Tax=Paenibacillus turpanensis TaxID=2689078 RepID=UPI00140D954E|nr:iron ABC transporter permease [Paenibacillus turpanensis]